MATERVFVCQHFTVKTGYATPTANCRQAAASDCQWHECSCGITKQEDYEQIRGRNGSKTHSPYCAVGRWERNDET